MSKFDKDLLIRNYESKNAEIQTHVDNIKKIITDSKAPLEGNIFYTHQTFNLHDDLIIKRLNLFWCGMSANTHICEIGFNAGHSTMILLLGRVKQANFTIFDIGRHPYTKPSLEYIKKSFPSINFEYVEGDSIKQIPKWIEENKSLIGQYDLIHVDGGHSEECVTNDMKNADKLLKVSGIIIIDDTNLHCINKCVNNYISTGDYIEVNLIEKQPNCRYHHRIIQKIN
jgi:hypothetical protein